ncbi:MGDG synthase family glycosyltransferase [Aneurinibacillus terranovensis]|uniref:MGDG synthase family glycosyltransferase n=1 Tax=Aneurinibacillus terranovensis TaxID=278991 RepID=UPI000402F057|nr:glycosyltransferase [Aneurinibacillus terranovensis]
MEPMKEKILILSGSYGNGHKQAARALCEAVPLRFSNVDTVMIDFMELIHPYLHRASRHLFIQGVKRFPALYGYLYHKTRYINSFSRLQKTFNILGVRRLINLLQRTQPTVVVSTFPIAAGAMSMLKSYGLTDVPTVTVITDQTDHGYWIHPHTNQYVVGSDFVGESLKQLGIPEYKITATGIPIRPKFCQTFAKESLKAKHGVAPNLSTVLVMGGGCGIIGGGVQSLLALNNLPQKVNLIIVCGENNKLKQQLAAGLKDSKHQIHLTGYIDYVEELMAIADIIITKPGGITTAEAIAMELPMLLYKPLPGQEEDNARFLLQTHAAIQADDDNDLTEKLAAVLTNSALLGNMKETARRLHQKQAAFDALDVILQTRFKAAR